ncbi:MAG: tannase/feruloyl esterase family alpha/beta hydrolase [Rhodospirillaceae bacterium]|nr:tannase/feruloyl esterase family alpha/beta hydrolase [Rhodospirillaceae bacterium]
MLINNSWFAGLSVFAFLSLLVGSAHAQSSAATCTAFGGVRFTIENSTPGEVKKGHVVDAINGVPAYCELSGFIAPQVGFEIRLPIDGWNGRFLQQGCSGMCGKLVLDAANDALSRGYATATTDMGHRAVSSRSGIWAYNDPSAKTDYWYRGTHVVALAAKQLISEYYGRSLDRSLYRGCGTGGRAGLIEAQRYPNDFDGVLITGGSVLNFVRNNYSIMWGIKSNLDDNDSPILRATDLDLVYQAVLKECATDGTGVVSNPLSCTFDPGTLACSKNNTNQCLSDEKVSAVRKYYDGPTNSSGEQLYAGQSKGSELGWSRGFFGSPSVMGDYIIEHYRYLLYPEAPGPSFELSQVDFDEPLETFSDVDTQSAADRVDYEGFKARGGKLLMTYGWNESSMPGTFTTQYFDRVEQANGGVSATQDFFRLFMVPGNFFCRGGSPAGQGIDLLTAMEAWVEDGRAPSQLIATTKGEERARMLYPYPSYGAYGGEGDPSRAESYVEKRPNRN